MPRPPAIWQYADGGRAAAGFKDLDSDCVARALAIGYRHLVGARSADRAEVYTLAYAESYAVGVLTHDFGMGETGRKRWRKKGEHPGVYQEFLADLFKLWGMREVPMGRVRFPAHVLRREIPNAIYGFRDHVAAVVNGTIYDTHNCSRRLVSRVFVAIPDQHAARRAIRRLKR